MPARKTVYDHSGDEPVAFERYAVVADELVAVEPDRYSFSAERKRPAPQADKPGKSTKDK